MEINETTVLDDRGFIQVSGDEAKEFLQNIVTNDIEKVSKSFTLFSSVLFENYTSRVFSNFLAFPWVSWISPDVRTLSPDFLGVSWTVLDLPGFFPDLSWIFPRCVPDASQISSRCFQTAPDASG